MKWRTQPAAQHRRAGLCGLALILSLGCEQRSDDWSQDFSGIDEAVGLSGSVAIRDKDMDRFLFLHSGAELELEVSAILAGKNVVVSAPSADRKRLLVLSRGESPRLQPEDEGPRLSIYSGGRSPRLERKFELDDPMTKLAIDPQGEWVAAYAGDATVTNDNELVLFSLSGDSTTPVARSIRSFGGSPVELVFTDELLVPRGGARRFLVVRTDRDVTIVDLKNLQRPEVTVKLPERADQLPFAPLQVAYHDGDPEVDDDAQIAVRLSQSSDVVMLNLSAAEEADKDFKVTNNIVDVGGVPTSIEFVRTDGGLRLAALVPSALKATLVNPDTIQSESVELPFPFDRMTRITGALEETPEGGDVALLWGSGAQIAFWSLGETSATPFRSIDSNVLSFQVARVIDVPAPNAHLKVLEGANGSGFFVLDLQRRQSFPLSARSEGYAVQASPDGERLWISNPRASQFSTVTLDDLHPSELYVQPQAGGLFEVEQAGDGRALIILHQGAGLSATVMNAKDPSSAETKFYPALELEGLE